MAFFQHNVPQGSVLGPVLFSLYTAPIEDIVYSHGLHPMFYADDSQTYIAMETNNRSQAINEIEQCVDHIISWYSLNFLQCNTGKTKVIHFSSRFINTGPIGNIEIGGTKVEPESEVCDLGVVLHKHLNMRTHINNTCKSASLAIHNIGKIRNYLDQPTTEKLVHAFVTSKLDFCNCLLYGLPKKETDKLQRILNSAARITTRTKKFEHITPVLRNLHWLSVPKRINFKILTLTYKALNGMAPSYLTDLLQVHHPIRTLRSASSGLLLNRPYYRTETYGARSFAVAAPSLWNSLPVDLRNTKPLASFKKKLKTFLFNL